MESVVLPFRTNRKPVPAWMVETTQEAWQRECIKRACEDDHIAFTSYFFNLREGVPFRLNWHHLMISDAIQKVIDGVWTNVVINVAPGASKTELAVINLIARGLALNPYARFLHISYSDNLALLNSQKARELMQSDEYQELWPLLLRDDSRSIKRWNVEVNGRTAGGVYAVSLGGQIPGFRAGRMVAGFQGAVIVDDPLKTEGSYSKQAREKANRLLVSTVKSRRASPATPIIVIMQRLAVDDCTGFIKAGGLPGQWHFVEIPALIDARYVEHCAHAYKRCIDSSVTDNKGRFSYWPYKEPLEELLALEQGGTSREGQRISRRVFSAQYQQRPTEEGGNLIKGQWFGRWRELPHIVRRVVIGDTAQKTSERNDFSVFMEWALGVDGRIYAVNLVRDRWEAPDLKRGAVDFWQKCRPFDHRTNVSLSALMVEDKSSGTGLIQDIKRSGHIPVLGIPRNRDKVVRVKGAAPSIEAGLVMLPEEATWVSDFVTECEAFTEDDSHAHDDQVDVLCDAVEQLLTEGASMRWVS